MQKVDEYARQAGVYRTRGARMVDPELKAGFEALAFGFEVLARERLALLQAKQERGKLSWDNGDADPQAN